MKRFLLAIAVSLLLLAPRADASVGQCLETTTDLSAEYLRCTDSAQNVNIATGTLTAVTTVGTITNVVSVDDNASSLTVDGTVTTSPTVLTDWEYDYATVATTATGTITLSATSTKVMVCNSCSGIVTMRFDGTDASATSGVPLFPNACIVIEDAAIAATGVRYYNAHTGDCTLYSQARR
ncbi:hypothetical protein [Sulfuricurvum sp.]|uniref:hypothetical protein n=1 Tax=Sulfuricurvum sp. TaxID=2025608 RepID=UPI0035676F96